MESGLNMAQEALTLLREEKKQKAIHIPGYKNW
jgi:hypothetical protein